MGHGTKQTNVAMRIAGLGFEGEGVYGGLRGVKVGARCA